MYSYGYLTLFVILILKHHNGEELNISIIFSLAYILNYLSQYIGVFLSQGFFYSFELEKVI